MSQYQREILSFDEKIALAELEVTKAEERVKEIKFHKARFMTDFFMEQMKHADQETRKP